MHQKVPAGVCLPASPEEGPQSFIEHRRAAYPSVLLGHVPAEMQSSPVSAVEDSDWRRKGWEHYSSPTRQM